MGGGELFRGTKLTYRYVLSCLKMLASLSVLPSRDGKSISKITVHVACWLYLKSLFSKYFVLTVKINNTLA